MNALVLVVFVPVLLAQSDSDRERRLAELERKILLLDPAFKHAATTFDDRLAAL